MSDEYVRTGRHYNGEQVLAYGRVGRWLWIADPSRDLAYVLDGEIFADSDRAGIVRAYDSAADTWDASVEHRTARDAAVKLLSAKRRHKCRVQVGENPRHLIGFAWVTAAWLEEVGTWRQVAAMRLEKVREIAESCEVPSQYSGGLSVELSMA